jgi:hypothetical protein
MNYLGSSLFIINLDFNYKFQREIEKENSFDSLGEKKKSSQRGKRNRNSGSYDKQENMQVFLPAIK